MYDMQVAWLRRSDVIWQARLPDVRITIYASKTIDSIRTVIIATKAGKEEEINPNARSKQITLLHPALLIIAPILDCLLPPKRAPKSVSVFSVFLVLLVPVAGAGSSRVVQGFVPRVLFQPRH